MTGRALYEKFTDSLAEADEKHRWGGSKTDLPGSSTRRGDDGNTAAFAPRAWPYLTAHDKTVWNALARRLTHSKRKASR